jgi:uncharacterized protein YpmS
MSKMQNWNNKQKWMQTKSENSTFEKSQKWKNTFLGLLSFKILWLTFFVFTLNVLLASTHTNTIGREVLHTVSLGKTTKKLRIS